mmetsp:Transcript_478/g.1488  ORF Transcript_478/g.1488 Transcript_478/m.1488 type:complete len:215 (-) Transcript_478:383-1027(-)
MDSRCFWSGRPTRKLCGSLLSTASSTSQGLLVAPRTMTWEYSSVVNPSQSAMNSVFMLFVASCSLLCLLPSIESISSMKMMLGWSFMARVKTAVTSFWASPNHLLCKVAALTLMKQALDSFAMALASMVFPVPGGPYRSTPFTGFNRLPRAKRSGRLSGKMTSSYRRSLMAFRPPILSKETERWSGLITSQAMTSSYVFVCTVRPSLCLISFLR